MARRLPNEIVLVARGSTMAIAIVAAATLPIGSLYWLRAGTLSWPGPRISDALPLDELPGRSGVSLLAFLLTFAVSALLLGWAARALQVDGLSAALATGGGVATWLYFSSAISLFVVRQVPFSAALDESRGLESIYIGASLCAIAVGLLARRPIRGQIVSRLTIAAVILLGIVDLFIGTVPRRFDRNGLPFVLAVGSLSPAARAISATVGALVLLTLAGLGRRSRRAAQFALILAGCSILLPLAGGFSVTMTILAALVILLIFAGREHFAFPGDPDTRVAALVRVIGTAVATLCYGLLALFINRTAADLPFHFAAGVRETYRELLGMSTVPRLSGGFAEWFPWSLRAIVSSGLLSAVAIWFGPWRQRLADDRRGHLQALGIVRRWGSDSLAPFTLRTDKAFFFWPEGHRVEVTEQVLIAYRALRGIALVSGDPVGPEASIALALRAFQEYCAERGWKIAILGASDRYLNVYRQLGMRYLYHGEEAVLDTDTFTLAGGELKSVRQAAHRLARNGFSVAVTLAGNLGSEAREELMALESNWLAGARRKGFVMELDELFRLDGEDAVFVTGRDPTGQIVGFLELAVCPASQSLSLSSMPRSKDAPNGLNAFLIVEVVAWAAEHGYREISLNFSPFARLLDPNASLRGLQQFERRALLGLKRLLNLQLDNLLAFNRHFAPRWQRRYLIYERRRHLVRVVIVAMAAERYLPFTSWVLGRQRESTAASAQLEDAAHLAEIPSLRR